MKRILKWLFEFFEEMQGPSLKAFKLPFVQWLMGTLVGVVTAMTIFYTRVSAVPALQDKVVQLERADIEIKAETTIVKHSLGEIKKSQNDLASKTDKMYFILLDMSKRKP